MLIDRRTILLGTGTTAIAATAGLADPSSWGGESPLPLVKPETVGMSAQALAGIDGVIAEHIARDHIQGAVTAVSRYNRLVHFRAHGWSDVKGKVPMRPDALFRMMSSTKPITAIAILQQMEEGRLGLEDPIGKFIPQLASMQVLKPDQPQPDLLSETKSPAPVYRSVQLEPQAREIRIRDLLTHTSGLDGRLQHQVGDTLATFVPQMGEMALDFQPGSRWSYSAVSGPDVLARIVELTSGLSFGQYLSERIFGPVGMIDTAHNLSAPQWQRLVHRYMRYNDRWISARGNEIILFDGSEVELPLAAGNTTYIDGSGGLKSTAADYIRLYTMFANRGEIDGRQVLRPDTVALMTSDLAYGLYYGNGEDLLGSGRSSPQGMSFGAFVAIVNNPIQAKMSRPSGSFGWGGALGTDSWANTENGIAAVIMLQQPAPKVSQDFDVAVNAAILS